VQFLAVVSEPLLLHLKDMMQSAHNQQLDWQAAGFKPMSAEGYDVGKNGQRVDYGNFAYRSLLQAMTLENKTMWTILRDMSTFWGSLYPDSPDSDYVLSQQGDIIEILMAYGRGARDRFDLLNMWDMKTPQEWKEIYTRLVRASKALNYLAVMLRGGAPKDDQCERMPKMIHLDPKADEIIQTSHGFAAMVSRMDTPRS
jgi:hypothetical protein